MTPLLCRISHACNRHLWSRLTHDGVAGNMLADGAQQLTQGRLPRFGDLILMSANAHRVGGKLVHVRRTPKEDITTLP